MPLTSKSKRIWDKKTKLPICKLRLGIHQKLCRGFVKAGILLYKLNHEEITDFFKEEKAFIYKLDHLMLKCFYRWKKNSKLRKKNLFWTRFHVRIWWVAGLFCAVYSHSKRAITTKASWILYYWSMKIEKANSNVIKRKLLLLINSVYIQSSEKANCLQGIVSDGEAYCH